MNKFKTSAIEILKKIKKPLHYKEITRLALEAGILETEGATPDNSMNAQIVTDIKNRKETSDFIKIAPSTYALNPKRQENVKEIKIAEKEAVEDEKIKIESGYTGKGGEHFVCGEMLFRGFNASIMSVDVGIDIAAIKENKFFGVQVKTANRNTFDTYSFHIKRSSFERHNQGNTFYIFVLRSGEENKLLILPCSEIEKKINEGAIFSVNDKTGYALSIKFREGNIYLGNVKHEMNYYLNNWGLIK